MDNNYFKRLSFADNKEVLLVVLTDHTGIVKDAIEEIQQVLKFKVICLQLF